MNARNNVYTQDLPTLPKFWIVLVRFCVARGMEIAPVLEELTSQEK